MSQLNSSVPSRFLATRRRNASDTLLSQSFQRLRCKARMLNHGSSWPGRVRPELSQPQLRPPPSLAIYLDRGTAHRTRNCILIEHRTPPKAVRALPARKPPALCQQLKCQKLFAATWERSSLAARWQTGAANETDRRPDGSRQTEIQRKQEGEMHC